MFFTFRVGAWRLLPLLWLAVALPGGARAAQPPPITLSLDAVRAWLGRPGLPDTTRVLYLTRLSALLQTTDVPAARQAAARAVALARRRGFGRGEAGALSTLAAMEYYAGDYPAAQRTFEATLRVSRRLGLGKQIGHAYLGLGNVAQALGNVPRALGHFEQARRAYATLRPTYVDGQLLVLNNSANAYKQLKQPANAGRALRQALALLPAEVNPHLVVGILDGLADLQNDAGDADSARATLERGLAIAHGTRDAQGEAQLRLRMAELDLTLGQSGRARGQAELALTLARQVGDPFLEEDALNVLAGALHALHRPEAYDTLRRYLAVHDTALTRERAGAIIEAQTRFDVAGQQDRIRALEQQRRIATLEAEYSRLRHERLIGWLLLVAVVLVAGVVGWYRRRQARREAQLRNRLAADLHDDVGALLSRIALQSDLLQEGLTPPEQQPTQWAEVATSSRSAIRQLNDVVWNLDAHNDTVPGLLHRLRDYAHELLPPTGREVAFAADPALPAAELPPLVRRNVYLIFKEALHNIIKYAPPACCVTITLRTTARQLVLTVTNDAPPGPAPGAGRTSGHGLRNIGERARAVGGTATAGPLPDGGFAVRVSVPL